MLSDTIQRFAKGQYFQDFLVYVSGDYAVTKGTGGTVAVSATTGATSGGVLKIPTAASANDYQSISTANPVFEFLAGKPTEAEAKITIAEAATNSSSWYVAFTDVLTTGFLSTAGAPPASFHGAVIWKAQGSNQIKFQTSNGTAKSAVQVIGTFVSGQALTVGITFDPGTDGVTGLCKAWINGISDTNGTPNLPQSIALAGMAPMYLSLGVVASTSAAETLQVDYWGAEWYR